MSEAAARIESAAELFAALRSPDVQLRLAVIGGLARDPRAAIELGTHEGRDVIDALIDTIRLEPEGSAFTIAFARILAVYGDPRVTAFFAESLAAWSAFDRVEVAARYLARTEDGAAQLRPLLWDMARPHHAHAAARALVEAAVELSERERMRAALLDGARCGDALEAWVDELRGPLAARATAQIADSSASEIRGLVGAWARLPFEAQRAVLEAARARDASLALPILVLATTTHPAAALACFAVLGAEADAVRPPLSRFVADGDAAVVAAAIAGARVDVDLEALLDRSRPIQRAVRCAALRRLAREQPDAEALLDALEDPAWEMRAVAASVIAKLGGALAPRVAPLLGHDDETVRLAAAQTLAIARL